MRIALHKADKSCFPSLPLMKLSAWHKTKGDRVSLYLPLFKNSYDLVYSSKVFSWTAADPNLPRDTVKGGTGYGLMNKLPEKIEHIMPDYSLYPDFTASLGFSTRGCIRNCPWCVVPKKEGAIRANAELEEFLRPDSRDLILMDNNILAHEHGLRQLEKSRALGLRVDCNQGLDCRIIAEDKYIAKLLTKVHWLRYIRLSCDTLSQMAEIQKAVQLIRRYKSSYYYEFFCYVLVKDIPDALERVEFLRKLKVKPFAQAFREMGSSKEPAKELKNFCRWVNHKAIFYSIPWQEYKYKQEAG